MLKRYHKPNKAPSSRVLKSGFSTGAAALSGTAFSAARGGEEGRGLNLKEEEVRRVQDRRVKEVEETPLELTPSVLLLLLLLLLCLAWRRREREGLLQELGEGLRRGREGEKVKAALCIFRDLKKKQRTEKQRETEHERAVRFFSCVVGRVV